MAKEHGKGWSVLNPRSGEELRYVPAPGPEWPKRIRIAIEEVMQAHVDGVSAMRSTGVPADLEPRIREIIRNRKLTSSECDDVNAWVLAAMKVLAPKAMEQIDERILALPGGVQ